jgi:hypothetical protein
VTDAGYVRIAARPLLREIVSGLGPDTGRLPRTVTITIVVGARQNVPCREAHLWLVSAVSIPLTRLVHGAA